MEPREKRQAKIDNRVAELRQMADKKSAEADCLFAAANQDGAFWTQPAGANAAGRAFARQRERERNKITKAAELGVEAKALRDQADAMEKRGAVMAGDADAERQAAIAAVDVAVGQIVNTIHYGARKVLKVNKKTILVEGSFGPLKIEKNFIRQGAAA